jgi:hypothetical protein
VVVVDDDGARGAGVLEACEVGEAASVVGEAHLVAEAGAGRGLALEESAGLVGALEDGAGGADGLDRAADGVVVGGGREGEAEARIDGDGAEVAGAVLGAAGEEGDALGRAAG